MSTGRRNYSHTGANWTDAAAAVNDLLFNAK